MHYLGLERWAVCFVREITRTCSNAGIAAGWSAVIVGVLLAIVAYVMVQKGTNDLKLSSLAPTRTAKNVKRDAATMKEVYDDK